MSGSSQAGALRQLRNRLPDPDQLGAFDRGAPATIHQACPVVVTVVDDGATPPLHTLVGLDATGTPNAAVTFDGVTPDGLALPLGTRGLAVQLTDEGPWFILTGVTGGATTMPAHSHTGGTDGPRIGIVS